MSGYTIGLIITGVIAFILATSILWGIKRGLKKTLFRLAWLVLSTVILLFTINPLSSWLNSFDLSSLNLDIGGEVTKLSDIGVNLLKSMGLTEEVLAENAALASFAQNLPAMILNVILFVVAFWLIKAFLWPLWAIISRALFDKQARQEKKLKKEAQKKQKEAKKSGIATPTEAVPQVLTAKQNKHRGWGAVFGLVMGLLVCAVTFSPVAGLNSIFQTAYNNITVEEDGKEVPYLSTVLDDQTLQFINSYETSIGSKVLTYTGMNALSSAMFSNLATVEVDNQKVYLTQEVDTFVNLYKSIVTLQSIDMQNLNQQSIDKLLTTVEKIFVDSEGSKILYLLGDELIPHFVDEFLEQEDIQIVDGDIIDEFLINAYRNSVDFALKEFKDEISAIVDIAFELNNNNLIAPVVNEEASSFEEIVVLVGTNVKNSQTFATNIVDSIYKIDMFEGEYAGLVKNGIESIFNSLGIEYAEQEVTSESVKNGLTTIIKNSVDVCKAYVKAGSVDFGSDASLAFSSVGTILDYVKASIFSTQNYNNLVDYLQTTLIDATSGLGDFSEVAESITEITSWKDELYSLANFYSAIVKISESGLTMEDISSEQAQRLVEDIGKGLQNAVKGNSKIVNNKNIKIALDEILKNVSLGKDVEEILSIEVDAGVTLKNHILNNIYNGTTSSIVDWQKEVEYNLAVFSEVYSLIEDGFDVDKLTQEGNTQLEEAGAAVDKALQNTKLALSHKVIRTVLEHLINNKAELSTEIKEILEFKDSGNVSVLNNMLNSIYYNGTNGSVSFETEFKKLINAVSEISKLDLTTIGKDNIAQIGATLDSFSGSEILNKHVLSTILSNYTDKLTNTMDATLKTKIQPFVDGIKQNYEKVDSFETELGYLVDLLNLVEDENVSLTTIGQKFDEILATSKLIEKENVTALIEGIFDDYVTTSEAGLKTAIQSIKANVSQIESYTTEFTLLDKLINCLGKTTTEIGAQIDNILGAPSKLIIKTNITAIVEHFFDEEVAALNLDAVDDEGLIAIIANIRENIVDIEDYSDEFTNLELLTDNINSEDLTVVGEALDTIVSANSNLITSKEDDNLVKDIVLHFFNKKSSDYSSGKFADIISLMEGKVESATSYKDTFDELNKIVGYMEKYVNITTTEQFKAATDLGVDLDTMAAMQHACDKNIAKSLATIMLDTLKTALESETGGNLLVEAVEETLNGEEYNFNNYLTSSYDYAVSHSDEGYYTDLIAEIKDVLNQQI